MPPLLQTVLSSCDTLTAEDDDVELSVAKLLVLVGDACSETAPPPQGELQQYLTQQLVGRQRLTVAVLQAVLVHRAQLETHTA